jgi:hypothetical protein
MVAINLSMGSNDEKAQASRTQVDEICKLLWALSVSLKLVTCANLQRYGLQLAEEAKLLKLSFISAGVM